MDPKSEGPPSSGDDELARRRGQRPPASPLSTVAGTGDGVVVELTPYRNTCACGHLHPSCVGFVGHAGLGGDAARIAQRLQALERLQAMLTAE